MSTVRFRGMLAACVVLAACDAPQSPREITAPFGATPLSDETATENGLGLTPDGPFDQVFAMEDPSAQQAAVGGQALGHVGLAFAPPPGTVVSEKYEFVALNIELAPSIAAKGELQVQLQTTAAQFTIHADVICLSVVGNRARMAARLELLFVNGVPVPPGEQYAVWTISDNGEGMGTPDMASLIGFTTSRTVALAHCTTGFALNPFPNQQGNVQVSP